VYSCENDDRRLALIAPSTVLQASAKLVADSLLRLRNANRTVVLFAHLDAPILQACDWIMLLRDGGVAASGSYDVLKERLRLQPVVRFVVHARLRYIMEFVSAQRGVSGYWQRETDSGVLLEIETANPERLGEDIRVKFGNVTEWRGCSDSTPATHDPPLIRARSELRVPSRDHGLSPSTSSANITGVLPIG
jgi:hypothetical protein